MVKRASAFILCIFFIINCTACAAKLESVKAESYDRYQAEFMGLFDTYAIIIGYAKTRDEFDKYSNIIYDRLAELDKLYTIYDDYEGVNNIRTINKAAGIEPVAVSQDIIDLLKLSKQAYDWSEGRVNVALGAVLSIWHDYRTFGKRNPDIATLPSMSELEAANEHTNINDLIIDEENSTVFLSDPKMLLDAGAIAKGYAAFLAIEDAKEAGMESALANIGGNIISVGKPFDNKRQRWGVGIQDPNLSIDGVSNIMDTVYLNDAATVCSGSYQRFFMVDDVNYHHIIDPETLMPTTKYKSVTVIVEDSKVADALSTALFIMDRDEGEALAKSFNAEVIWIYPDDSVDATDGYKAISRNMGNYSAVDK